MIEWTDEHGGSKIFWFEETKGGNLAKGQAFNERI